MDGQAYAALQMFIDQRAVMNITSIEQKTNTGLIPIKVLNYGLVGFAQGAGDIVISGTMMIPGGGFEEPIQTWAVKGSIHAIQIGCGPSDWAGKGTFMDCDIRQSVDQGAELSFTFMAPLAIFE